MSLVVKPRDRVRYVTGSFQLVLPSFLELPDNVGENTEHVVKTFKLGNVEFHFIVEFKTRAADSFKLVWFVIQPAPRSVALTM